MGLKATASKNRWNAAHYERVAISVPLGKRDEYKELAAKLGLSVNQLFIKAVEFYAAEQGIEIHQDTTD